MKKIMIIHNFCDGRTFRMAFEISILVILLVNTASAATIKVPNDYAKIQWAIDNATAGDTIEVYSGTYYENVIVHKQLILIGIGSPVVDASGSGNAITLLSYDMPKGSTLEGFTATNAEDGIMISGCNNTVNDNKASTNAHSGIEVISDPYDYSFYADNNILNDNFVSNNSIGIFLNGNGYGLSTRRYPNNNDLNNNTASNNNYGFILESANNNKLIGNKATYNTNYGIYIDSRGSCCGGPFIAYNNNNNLSYNTISNNDNGIYLISTNEKLLYNNISNNTHNGIYLSNSWCMEINDMNECSSNKGFNDVIHNKISNNGNGIYVEDSLNNNFKDNIILNNNKGIIRTNSDTNFIFNNYFYNVNNSQDNGKNIWH